MRQSAKSQSSNPITDAECAQMSAMYNWSHDNSEVQEMRLVTYKRFVNGGKSYNIIYSVSSNNWVNNKWKTYKGEGLTLMQAMEAYSEDMGSVHK